MIKTASDGGVDSFISPIRGNSKHQMTPLRRRQKTSRKDQGTDVHTTCSTPNRFQSGIQCNNLNSPSDSFPYSQENYPDVIWDYTSPKLPKGTKKKEIKITVDEFLKNLTQNQAPECNTQTSHYIKLLEKWMAKQNTPVCVIKPLNDYQDYRGEEQNINVKRNCKMRSRRVMEEIKQFMASIEHKNKDQTEENKGKDGTSESNLPKTESSNQSSSSVNKKSFLEGDTNANDSIEELWGEADSSFMVKATQQLDILSSKYSAQNKNLEIVSTIPETISSTSNEPKYTTFETEQSTEKNSLNKGIIDSDYQAQILLTQIINCDWESDSDIEDLENGFIMEDEALSLIPDEVLRGADTEHDGKENIDQSVMKKSCDKNILNDKKISTSNYKDRKPVSENRSCELSFGSSEIDKITFETVDQSEIELFNNFDDESFGDESILCEPEVLSWIDEVESKLSQSQKCTPEEIEKKKFEAIQRRKRNQSRSQNS